MKINRRSLLSLLGASPAILAGTSALAKENPKKSGSAAHAEGKIEAPNPRGEPPAIELIPMAPRPKSLDGKTVYLVSDGFPGADHFLDHVAIWFKKNMPSVGGALHCSLRRHRLTPTPVRAYRQGALTLA
jgi:hypothetical protein